SRRASFAFAAGRGGLGHGSLLCFPAERALARESRDRSKYRALGGPGSAPHHFVLRCARDTDADHLSVRRKRHSGSRSLRLISASNSSVNSRSPVFPRACSSLSQRSRKITGMVAT